MRHEGLRFEHVFSVQTKQIELVDFFFWVSLGVFAAEQENLAIRHDNRSREIRDFYIVYQANRPRGVVHYIIQVQIPLAPFKPMEKLWNIRPHRVEVRLRTCH